MAHHDHTDPQPGCRCEERYGERPGCGSAQYLDPAILEGLTDLLCGGKRSASHLSPPEMHRLDIAVRPIVQAIGTPFLVGSVIERRDFRDVDVRVILDDDQYDALPDAVIRLLGFLGSEYLRAATDLPVDFQIQRRTEANEAHKSVRNPLGGRDLTEFRGDAAPPSPGPPSWSED